MPSKNTYAVIVAGGSGQRFGGAIPKQYLPLGGLSLLRHSINAFLKILPPEHVRVVIRPEDKDLYKDCTTGLGLTAPAFCSDDRKGSVYNGIKNFPGITENDIILIHDAARPFICPQDIKNLCTAMENHKAATLCTPISDTLRYTENGFLKENTVERDHLYALQTPQAFRYGLLKKAHENANPQKKYTDDTTLVMDTGIPVKLVEGSQDNFKVTYPGDFLLAEKLLAAETRTEYRTGQGYDVHAFCDEEGIRHIRLCGVDIPFDRKLQGHSDADVGLHALTDAILGAIGEGDIGLHFPPSNMDFKDMDSAIFLKHAVKLMQSKGASLINADITLICERPKIGDHRNIIRKRVAELLGTGSDRVNIKATTTEKLGFTGRGEGIAAQACVSISMPIKRGEQ